MSLTTDVPFLNDLVLYLKNSPLIQEAFPSIGSVRVFVNPKEIEKVITKDCPFNEAIYIYLGNQRRVGSKNTLNSCYMIEQVIGLVVLKKCSGKNFELESDDGINITVGGEIAELACLRNEVIKAMQCFESRSLQSCQWIETGAMQTYECWLSSTLEFTFRFTN